MKRKKNTVWIDSGLKGDSKEKVDMSSGVKFDHNKVRYDLIPPYPLNELAKLYTFGAKKYKDRNWEKGLRWGRCFAALMRHAWAFWNGETYDKETGQHHLVHAVFCCFSLIEFNKTHKEFDDRPTTKKS